jgi:hypothetical protein
MLSGHVTERPASDGSIVFLTHRFERNGEEVVDIRSSVERLGQGASTTETILDDSSQIDTIVPAGGGYYLARATQRNAWVPRVGYAPADIEVVRLDGAGHVSRVDLPRLECCTDMHWNDEQAILLLHGNERTGSGALDVEARWWTIEGTQATPYSILAPRRKRPAPSFSRAPAPEATTRSPSTNDFPPKSDSCPRCTNIAWTPGKRRTSRSFRPWHGTHAYWRTAASSSPEWRNSDCCPFGDLWIRDQDGTHEHRIYPAP